MSPLPIDGDSAGAAAARGSPAWGPAEPRAGWGGRYVGLSLQTRSREGPAGSASTRWSAWGCRRVTPKGHGRRGGVSSRPGDAPGGSTRGAMGSGRAVPRGWAWLWHPSQRGGVSPGPRERPGPPTPVPAGAHAERGARSLRRSLGTRCHRRVRAGGPSLDVRSAASQLPRGSWW